LKDKKCVIWLSEAKPADARQSWPQSRVESWMLFCFEIALCWRCVRIFCDETLNVNRVATRSDLMWNVEMSVFHHNVRKFVVFCIKKASKVRLALKTQLARAWAFASVHQPWACPTINALPSAALVLQLTFLYCQVVKYFLLLKRTV
jgi:hypothetical protein